MSENPLHSEGTEAPEKLGIAGRMAQAFINSKLTPLIIVASLLLGWFATKSLAREEEPQIIVPMADLMVPMPGASAAEVERRVTIPMEKLVWEIPGVEYLYGTSNPGSSMLIVRFKVGEDLERSLVRLREKLASHFDEIPPGVGTPILKPRSIDDVPILALTLHSKEVDGAALRQLAGRLEDNLKQVPNISETKIIGGSASELMVTPDKVKLAGYGLSLDTLAGVVQSANRKTDPAKFDQNNASQTVTVGELFQSPEELGSLVVGSAGDRPIYLRDVATVSYGAEDPVRKTWFQTGAKFAAAGDEEPETAVTLSLAKRPGTNAIDVVHAALDRVEEAKREWVPGNVQVTVTRDYGDTAAEKSNELLFHMMVAVVSVTVLIAMVLGIRESLVVLVAIPVTLGLTLLVFKLYGYTLNRITLFALIFSIGILVDDAIVVVENVVRHYRMPKNKGMSAMQVAVKAVDEVGNPTILATFTVIAAILPMAFVGGLMGPYMRPIPVGATAAMLFSLAIAFMVTPWAAIRLLKKDTKGSKHGHGDDEMPNDFLTRLYRKIMTPLLRKPVARFSFFTVVGVLLLGSMGLVAIKAVTVKMLPFDNKSEFQVIVDMPNGTTLEQTAEVTKLLGERIRQEPEVKDLQGYVGTAAPYNFNGLVRHYFLRALPHQADLQVNLVPKHDRKAQSHDLVKRIRPAIEKLAKEHGARVKLAEVPPGPPVLSTLVAEVYGPTFEDRYAWAKQVKSVFETTEGVSDVDWYYDDEAPTFTWKVDREKAAASGVSVDAIARMVETALTGRTLGALDGTGLTETVPLKMRLNRAERSGVAALEGLTVADSTGNPLPISEFVTLEKVGTDRPLYRKNLQSVLYVTGEVVGKQESPVYAIMAMNKKLESLREGGAKLEIMSTSQPSTETKPAMKWDGEWHITYEVFRDLGIAFAVVMILIFALVVFWFQSFKTPIAIMAPIPLTLIGILPGHALMNAFFTATSMIGFIAGAGIIVRNSIILVDFIEQRRREGAALEQAVIEAGAIRFRPMLLTAAAVIVGSFMILFDPIFQGLAISLMAGEIASTLLSRIAVPVLYYMQEARSARSSL